MTAYPKPANQIYPPPMPPSEGCQDPCINGESETGEVAVCRVVEPTMDTAAPMLPYPDLPADHPANVDAIAKTSVSTPLRLNLACGAHVLEGFEGVDKFADVKHKVDLLTFPWPWETSSVAELFCSHFIEHIPMHGEGPEDLLIKFMDEAWRVLQPDGVFVLIWPALQSVRAFQDPTHRRFIPMETMLYFQKDFRQVNGLGHYLGACDFQIDGPRTTHLYSLDEAAGRTDEAIVGMIKRNWNFSTDSKATLIAKK